jgi:type I restriction enzyme S subunit
MKNISKSKLLDLLLAIPSQAEQREIASIMQEIDASIEADNLTLKGQIATKSALMSDLLTGRKRVTDALPMAAE